MPRRHQKSERGRLRNAWGSCRTSVDPKVLTKTQQVYFIDNDEYFKRKATFSDEDGVMYPDNDERAIFFAKGVVETVKKLNWVPDIIHVHGWMAGLLPVYMKHYYKDEALFSDTKIVTSVYGQSFDGTLNTEMINKIKFDNIPQDAIQDLELPNYENLIKSSVMHSDAVIIASENLSSSLTKFIESSGKPFLPFATKDKFAEAYTNFYKAMLP
jgi:starch synthase